MLLRPPSAPVGGMTDPEKGGVMPEKSESFETQVLDAVKEAQEAMVGTVRAWAEALQRALPDAARAPEMRYADRLPDPAAVVGQVFDFAEALLKTQREFALNLVEAAEPVTRSVGLKVGDRPTPVPPQKARHAPSARPAPKRGSAAVRSA